MKELIALVGGFFDGKCFVNPDSREHRLTYRIRDIDERSYLVAAYERGLVGQDGMQEYVFVEDVIMYVGSHAAAGEDIWLLQQFPAGFKGYAADVGAYDGRALSNTELLELQGWTVLCIEPQPELETVLKARRNLVEMCACGSQNLDDQPFYVHTNAPPSYSALAPTWDEWLWKPVPEDVWDPVPVQVRTLNTLLEKHQFPRLDALSIDVEGAELDVLKGIDLERWRPKAIIAESWRQIGPVVPYLAERGYRYVTRRNPNDMFLRIE